MNEMKHYNRMIKRAKTRNKPECYVEKHHVWPRSIYGEGEMVFLTAKEHFIAHFLLWKLFKKRYGEKHRKTYKMAHAFKQMTLNPHGNRYVSNSFAIAIEAANEAKRGVSRSDMQGKAYFGADPDAIRAGIEKMRQKKTGMKVNYPKNRKSPSCSKEKAKKISESRKKTLEKFSIMNKEEFLSWVAQFSLYRKDGRPNPNITRAIKARGEKLEDYYPNHD